MTTHSSILSMGQSHGQKSLAGYSRWGRRVGHNWSDLAAAALLQGYPPCQILSGSVEEFSWKKTYRLSKLPDVAAIPKSFGFSL